MSANSKIEWTEKTWNPIAAFTKCNLWISTGRVSTSPFFTAPDVVAPFFPKGARGWFCVKVSPGCANCYAEGINLRLGNGLTYTLRNLEFIEFRLVNIKDPLKWQKPCVVFVNSMTDLFLEHIPDEMIDMVFAVMALCGRHTFQVLTKRHLRMRDYMVRLSKSIKPLEQCAREIGYTFQFEDPASTRVYSTLAFPIKNVWLGVSVEDRPRLNRIQILRETPAAVRFLSLEPLLEDLGAVNFADRIDWVIIGGESGPKARVCNVDWIDDIRRQCVEANVPLFVKQLGAVPVTENANRFEWPDDAKLYEGKPSDRGFAFAYIKLRDRKGGDPAEWPEDLRIREFPKTRVQISA